MTTFIFKLNDARIVIIFVDVINEMTVLLSDFIIALLSFNIL